MSPPSKACFAVAAIALALAAGPRSAPADSYAYACTAKGARDASVSLTAATVRSGHVAVWLGVDDGIHWIQAGIMKRAGDTHPWVYVETDHSLELVRPTRLGERVRVELVHRGSWHVRVNGRALGVAWLAYDVTRMATAEDLRAGAPNSYRASLNGSRCMA
jgi:hypothetical protein